MELVLIHYNVQINKLVNIFKSFDRISVKLNLGVLNTDNNLNNGNICNLTCPLNKCFN